MARPYFQIMGSVRNRLRLAFDMHDVGVQMYKLRMRREHPEETDKEIALRVQQWLLDRPDARLRSQPGSHVSSLDAAVEQISTELARLDRDWALVGGLAVSARSEPRFTRDIDIAVAIDGNVLRQSLLDNGYALEGSTECGAAIRARSTRQDVGAVIPVDLMTAVSGIEPEIAAAAEPVEIRSGRLVPVARTGHLVAVKLQAHGGSRRPQDQADLLALVAAADAEDLEMARDGCAIITERGFNRERDLLTDLDEVLTPSGGR